MLTLKGRLQHNSLPQHQHRKKNSYDSSVNLMSSMSSTTASVLGSLFYSSSNEKLTLRQQHQKTTSISDGKLNTRDNEEEEEEEENPAMCHKVSTFEGDQCAFARTYCPNPYASGFINYIQARYCWFKSVPYVFYVVASLWVLMLFYMLGDTAESNFSPSLLQMSRMLRLSPDVAGVTFLALGNGAPDIASIMAGVLSGSTGFGIAEPIGGGLFVTTVVMAAVTLFTTEVRVGFTFLRDVGTYLFSVIFVIVIVLTGRIVLWESLVCLLIYFLYVTFVVASRRIVKFIRAQRKRYQLKKDLKKLDNAGLIEEGGEAITERKSLLNNSINVITYDDTSQTLPSSDVGINTNEDEEERIEWYEHRHPRMDLKLQRPSKITPEWREHQLKQSGRMYVLPKIGILFEEPAPSEEGFEETTDNDMQGSAFIEEYFHPNESTLNEDDGTYEDKTIDRDPVVRALKAFGGYIGFNERGWFGKLTFAIEAPTILARNLTVPKADPADWNKALAVLNPIFMPMFVLFALQYYDVMVFGGYVPLMVLSGAIGIPFSLIVFATSRTNRTPLYHFAFVVLAFAMSVLWIYILANELVNLLQSIGIIWKVSDVILAITVLAWGNSLGDLFADMVVARQGFPQMAVAAIYGGPCLNLLIGLGIAVTFHCIAKDPVFPVTVSAGFIITFVFLIAALIAALVVVPICKFRSPKPLGILLLLLYVIFMVVSLLTEFGILWPEK